MASPFMARPQMRPQQGLLAQIQERLMPTPSSGLLTEDDIKNARQQGLLGLGASLLADSGPRPQGTAPGFMQSVGRAIQAGQGSYQGAQQNMMGSRMAEQQMQRGQQELALGQQELDASQGEQQLAQARQKLLSENPPPADQAGYVEWAKQMHAKLTQIGDYKFADHLKTIIATQSAQQQRQEPGQYVDVAGPNGQPIRRWATQDELRQGVPIYNKPQQRTHADPRPITLVNPETGKPEVALYDPATEDFRFTGKTPATIGAGSEAERKNQAIYELAAPHVELIDAADAPNRIEWLAANGKLNEFLNENRQMWEVSGKQLADAYLRLTTGAAYNKEELELATDQMVPRPGNTPALIALKRANRQRLMRALRAAAGRSWQESPDMGGEFSGVQSGGGSTAPSVNYNQYRQGKPQ